VEKALREAATRGEKCIFTPKEGQVFQTIEEGYEFLNMYSWEVGFGIRYGRSRLNGSNKKSRQDIMCSCQVIIFFLTKIASKKNSPTISLCIFSLSLCFANRVEIREK
jgi:hypothetical protein